MSGEGSSNKKTPLELAYNGGNLPPLKPRINLSAAKIHPKSTSQYQRNTLDKFLVRSTKPNTSQVSIVTENESIMDENDTYISLNDDDLLQEKELKEINLQQIINDSEKQGRINKLLTDIDNLQDDPNDLKTILKSIAEDVRVIVDENSQMRTALKVLVEERKDKNDLVKTVNSVVKSVDNFNKRVGGVDKRMEALTERVESVETLTETICNTTRLNLIILDKNESSLVEAGEITPRNKAYDILNYLEVGYNRNSIADVMLKTIRKDIDGKFTVLKMLEIRFNDTVSAGRIFGHIIRWNRSVTADNGKSVRYFVERPLGPKMLHLMRVCKNLISERKIIHAMPTDRGIRIKYAIKTLKSTTTNKDIGETSADEKFVFVTSESDIDKLRKIIGGENCDVPVNELYPKQALLNTKFTSTPYKRKRPNVSGNDDDNMQSNKKISNQNPNQH